MKMLLGNHLENAIEALRVNRWRTLLTMTGVVIAAGSITAVLSLASGATSFFAGQIAKTNTSVALVRPGSRQPSSESLLAQLQSLPTTTTLTEADARRLESIKGVSVTPLSTLASTLKSRDSQARGLLVGSNPHLKEAAALEVEDGDFLADNSASVGIVLGNQLSIDLFGTEHSIGSIVSIRGETFTVIGVLKPKKEPVNYLGIDFDRAAIMTVPALTQFTHKVAQIQQIILTTREPIAPVVSEAERLMTEQHHGEKDFFVASGTDVVALNNQLVAMLMVTIATITGIALLVGGIGIMNIMLVNAAERQREIGIRKAIGATRGMIIGQFLIEAAIIGLLGGATGYGIGLAGAFVIDMYVPFSMTLQWQAAALSIGIAMTTAVIFGLYPAVRAASKHPIEALQA